MELNGTISLYTREVGAWHFTPRELSGFEHVSHPRTKVKRKYFIKAYRHSSTTFRRIHKTKSISSTGFLILSGDEQQQRKGKNETEIITKRTGEIPLLIPNLSGCCHFSTRGVYFPECYEENVYSGRRER